MLIHGTTGTAIEDLQRQLIALGYPLPRWGVDGNLGNETLGAVARFLADHAGGYIDADPDSISDAEWDIIQSVYHQTTRAFPLPTSLIDLRRTSDSRHIIGRRPWVQITGITLHQCAVDFGHEPPARWNTLSAHVGVSCEGNVLWVHEFEHVIAHGNELNRPEIGIEFEGLFAGILAQPGGRTQHLTPKQIRAGHEAIRWILAVCANHGSILRFLHAHRQTAQTRRGDPGEEIWRLIALPMIDELGLTDGGPQFKIDNGRTIPAAWNPEYTGNVF